MRAQSALGLMRRIALIQRNFLNLSSGAQSYAGGSVAGYSAGMAYAVAQKWLKIDSSERGSRCWPTGLIAPKANEAVRLPETSAADQPGLT
jgi:hypothetical protein